MDVRHDPLVLVHGGGGQGLDRLATPDGREGWATLFLRQGFPVYVVDRPGMGRSPYHPALFGPPGPPAVYGGLVASFAGPAPDGGPEHTQWPGDGSREDPALAQFLAGQESFPASLAAAHEPMRDGAAALLDRIGPSVVLTHSMGSPFGWLAADVRWEQVRAIVAVEPLGPPFVLLPGIGKIRSTPATPSRLFTPAAQALPAPPWKPAPPAAATPRAPEPHLHPHTPASVLPVTAPGCVDCIVTDGGCHPPQRRPAPPVRGHAATLRLRAPSVTKYDLTAP
ncbi:MAG: hypothetical protein JWM19_5835 [Actinomycetia bacterium]|nr:hypothetical protein [Actinomycetes bacterium]